jgi:hypothetical protein
MAACGSSPPSSHSPDAPADAGEAGATSEGGLSIGDAGDADALALPVCTSVPSGPRGTVTTQGSLGFAIAGGGAWTSTTAFLPTADGGLEPAQELLIDLTDQVDTCVVGGNYLTGVTKAKENYLYFELTVPGDQLPGPGTYTLDPQDSGPGEFLIDVGQVTASCDGITNGSGNVQIGWQSTLTLTEVATDHVKGTYSLNVYPPVSGTFDVPLCPAVQHVAQMCCLP